MSRIPADFARRRRVRNCNLSLVWRILGRVRAEFHCACDVAYCRGLRAQMRPELQSDPGSAHAGAGARRLVI
eukprot:1042216-Pyramimonas_sp.AAC.1